MDNQTQDIGPWYHQKWLWFVLAPLIAVVIYASIFMYIAITTSDGIVKDDYYRVARGTNVDTSRIAVATERAIKGELLVDALTGDLRLSISSNQELPTELTLDLVHPSHQKYDQSIRLRSVNGAGVYLGSLQANLEGKRYLMLSDTSGEWLIKADLLPPYDQRIFALGAQ